MSNLKGKCTKPSKKTLYLLKAHPNNSVLHFSLNKKKMGEMVGRWWLNNLFLGAAALNKINLMPSTVCMLSNKAVQVMHFPHQDGSYILRVMPLHRGQLCIFPVSHMPGVAFSPSDFSWVLEWLTTSKPQHTEGRTERFGGPGWAQRDMHQPGCLERKLATLDLWTQESWMLAAPSVPVRHARLLRKRNSNLLKAAEDRDGRTKIGMCVFCSCSGMLQSVISFGLSFCSHWNVSLRTRGCNGMESNAVGRGERME